jgi:hypothetical protein
MKTKLLLAVVLLAAPAAAAPLPAPKEASANLVFSFKLKNGLREAAGRFLVGNGNQSNYVAGGEVAKTIQAAQGKGVEYKKVGVIVNCLPTLHPDGRHARVECQFEISGPGRKNPDLDAWDIDTFQYQAGFMAELGKPLVLVDEPERRVELTIALAP